MKGSVLVWSLIVCLVALGGFITCSKATAEDPVTVVGAVSAATDDDGNVTAVKLVTEDDDVYKIVLDANGKKLGQEMDGEKVKVTGTVAEKDEQLWLTVQKCEKVKGGAEE